jgi:hypothetical protein
MVDVEKPSGFSLLNMFPHNNDWLKWYQLVLIHLSIFIQLEVLWLSYLQHDWLAVSHRLCQYVMLEMQIPSKWIFWLH